MEGTCPLRPRPLLRLPVSAAGGGRLRSCSRPFPRQPGNKQKKKKPYVSAELLSWCAERDSPAHFPTVRRTVGPGRDANRPDVLFSSLSEATREQTKKKKPYVFVELLSWCAERDSPAHFPTVRRTVGPGRDANRPDVLFSSLSEATREQTKKKKPYVFVELLSWCAERDSNPWPSDS